VGARDHQILYVIVFSAGRLTLHLGWTWGLLAMPVLTVIVLLLAGWVRGQAARSTPEAPTSAGEGAALPPVGPWRRTIEMASAVPVRAAGSNTLSDVIRYSRRAGRDQPTGDPEADREALLAGQSFRVFAYWKTGRRWNTGELRIGGQPLELAWRRSLPSLPGRAPQHLPLTPSARMLLTRPVAETREWFPNKGWLFTAVTIDTGNGREVLAVPTLDVPLVCLALEVANEEAALALGDRNRFADADAQVLSSCRPAPASGSIPAGPACVWTVRCPLSPSPASRTCNRCATRSRLGRWR
jgi:hypothetical protein